MDEMWFGLDDEVSCRRHSFVRHRRVDMSLLQEELSTRRFERFRTLIKVRHTRVYPKVSALR